MGRILFEEKQPMKNKWIMILLFVISLTTIVYLIFVTFQQIAHGVPFGEKPISNFGLIALVTGITSLLVSLNWFFLISFLQIRIKDNCFHYQFYPFMFSEKPIRKDEIKQYQMININPIYKFGGYGHRKKFLKKSIGMFIAGRDAIEIIKNDGRKITIGTQRPLELEKAVNTFMNKPEDF